MPTDLEKSSDANLAEKDIAAETRQARIIHAKLLAGAEKAINRLNELLTDPRGVRHPKDLGYILAVLVDKAEKMAAQIAVLEGDSINSLDSIERQLKIVAAASQELRKRDEAIEIQGGQEADDG